MRPVIYQILTRIFGAQSLNPQPWGSRDENGCGKMSSISNKVLADIREMGFTHVWCTGLIRHATCTHYNDIPDCNARVVKGLAGSPYAITDYYDIDPDLADIVEERREEYLSLVNRVHSEGLKLVIDFVPNHVSREYKSIICKDGVRDLGADDDKSVTYSFNNNFIYFPDETLHTDNLPVYEYARQSAPYIETPARATGNDVFNAWPGCNDWYETVKLNYGRPEDFCLTPNTWVKMTEILLHWASTGVDAFRCDMAEMVPVEFWHYAISRVKSLYPNIQFIAEVYNPSQYRSYIKYGGFDFLYDKVGLYDCVRDVMCGNRWAGEITHSWQSVDDIHEHMLGFLENHDEQRIASPQFAGNAEIGKAGMIATIAVSTSPVMIYAGQEVGEAALDAEGFSGKDGRTTIFDYWTVDKLRRMLYGNLTSEEIELKGFYSKLLNACNTCECLREGELYDLMYCNPPSAEFDAQHLYVCLRYTKKERALIVANFLSKNQISNIIIPTEAFSHTKITTRSRNVRMRDALSDYEVKTTILADTPIRLEIPANSGVIMIW